VKRRRFSKRVIRRTNWQIRAPNVRLIDDQGKQIGVVSLQKAREIAKKKELDLVEIAPNAKPPVVRVVDYAKFNYQQEKKEREERKKKKRGDKLKEIQLTPFIGQADLKTRVERAKGFAKEGDRLRIVVKFRGRQITQKQFGYQLLDRVKEELVDFYQPEREGKFSGKRLILALKPIKKSHEKEQKTENQKKDQKVSR